MSKPEIHNPFFFYRGRRFEGVIGARNEYQHSFGAVGGFAVRGQPSEKRGLHQLLTLDTRDPILADIFSGAPRLPIYYPFHYETGLVEYEFAGSGMVTITALDESSYDQNWPYRDYPEAFPVHPFTLTQPKACDLSSFARDVWQGIEPRFADHFIAIIPASDAYGVHLWRRKDNFDDIHIKCFVNPATKHAIIYNECD